MMEALMVIGFAYVIGAGLQWLTEGSAPGPMGWALDAVAYQGVSGAALEERVSQRTEKPLLPTKQPGVILDRQAARVYEAWRRGRSR